MPDQTGLIAAFIAIGGAIGALGKWLLDWRRQGREASGVAMDQLAETIKLMRGEIERVTASVGAAREEAAQARRETAESRQAEARCQQRVADLREDIQALRNAMERGGIPVPALRSLAHAAE